MICNHNNSININYIYTIVIIPLIYLYNIIYNNKI